VQAADRGVGVPGAARAVLREDAGESGGIVGEMLERHRAILDERDRLAGLLHGHHDVEAGGAHLGDRGLQLGIEHLDDAAPFGARVLPGEAVIAHELLEAGEAAQVLGLIALGELDEQDRLGIAAHHRLDGGLEHGDLAREAEHGAIDELDRDRPKLDDVLRHVHRPVEAAEMAGADRALADERRKLELDRGGKGERALGADQDMREIEVVAARRERIEIVAADPPLHLGKARLDLVRLRGGQRQQALRQREER